MLDHTIEAEGWDGTLPTSAFSNFIACAPFQHYLELSLTCPCLY